jgi:glycosyltransferase involved in cell wall biosynthesis
MCSVRELCWIGPWHTDVGCHQVRGAMVAALQRCGWHTSSVIVGDPGSWKTGGYDEVAYLPTRRTIVGKLVNQFRLAWIVAHLEVEILVLGEKASHLAVFAWLGRFVRRSRMQIVLDVRTLPVTQDQVGGFHLRYIQLRMGFPFADGWTAITHRLADVIQDCVRTRGLPFAIWESGVSASWRLAEVDTDDRILAHGHEVNLLYLGSIDKVRDLDLAVRAMASLGDDCVGLHLVGGGDDVATLRKQILDRGLSRRIHLYDPVSYDCVPSVIKACDVGLLSLRDCPAWNTSSALKLFEYMAMAKPVIVSDIPAHRDLLDGRSFAFFMPEYSASGLVAALNAFCTLEGEKRRAAGTAARDFVMKGHTWDDRARTITAFFNAL